MYKLDHVCVPDIKKRSLPLKASRTIQNAGSPEELTLPGTKRTNILRICYCKGMIQPESTKAEEDGIHIEGVLHLMFFVCREDDQMPFGVWQGMVPFTYLLENGGGEPEAEELDWTVEQLRRTYGKREEVEVKAVLAFNCFQKEPCYGAKY